MVEKIIVTGAGGLLGYALVRQAIARGFEVCSLDFEHMPDCGRPIKIDLTDPASVKTCIETEKPQVVVNTASLTDVDLCERNPELAMRVNGAAAGYLAETCENANAFLIHLSTDYVFDGNSGNFNENDKPAPVNQYGASKLLGEQLVLKHKDTCVGRTSVIYGWGRTFRPNFGTWLHSKLSKGEKVNVVSDQFASPTLNTNLAGMILELMERRWEGLIHLAGATRINRFDFAVKLATAFHFEPSLITSVKSDSSSWIAARPKDSSLDVTKAKTILNMKPLTVEEALREFAQTTVRAM